MLKLRAFYQRFQQVPDMGREESSPQRSREEARKQSWTRATRGLFPSYSRGHWGLQIGDKKVKETWGELEVRCGRKLAIGLRKKYEVSEEHSHGKRQRQHSVLKDDTNDAVAKDEWKGGRTDSVKYLYLTASY